MFITWFSSLIIFVFSLVFTIPGINTIDLENLIRPEVLVVQDNISADKAAVVSADGRFLLFSKRAEEVQPIASITKLMTALVFLETNPDWDDEYTITREDHILGGKIHLFLGDTVNLHDLFLTSLVASDNGATIALVRASNLSEEEFIDRMNEKAKELRLLKTSFSDPIGLSEDNVSTARETALLALAAYKEKEIGEALILKDYTFNTVEGREKFIESTDHLLFEEDQANFKPLGGKTGYTNKAGYCFAGIFQGLNGEIVVASVLNSEEKNSRFIESKTMVTWVLETYFSNQD